jgi:hypothetical protein
MKKRALKRILLYAFSTLLFLALALAVHIYMVYRPKITPNTRVMARIDIKQSITGDDATKISVFLAHEKGVDHYLVNPENRIVIFTFAPVKNNIEQIIDDFKTNFNYKAERFKPSAEIIKQSCPVAASSYGYKIYKFISQII